MKLRLNRTIRNLVASAIITAPLACYAGGIVFDPTNFIENLRSAISAINQEVLQTNQLAQLVQQVATAKNQFEQMKKDALRTQRSLKGMTPGEILNLAKNTSPELAVFSDLNDRVTRTSSNLRKLSDQYRSMESFGSYMNWNVSDVFWNEKLRNHNARDADRRFLQNIEGTIASVNRDIQQINRIRDNIGDTQTDDMQSLRKALETATVQLNMIAGQNTQVLSLMSEDIYSKRAQQVGDRTVKDQADQQGYNRAWNDYNRALQLRADSEARYRELWNRQGTH